MDSPEQRNMDTVFDAYLKGFASFTGVPVSAMSNRFRRSGMIGGSVPDSAHESLARTFCLADFVLASRHRRFPSFGTSLVLGSGCKNN